MTAAFAFLIAVVVCAIFLLVYSRSKKEAVRAAGEQFKKNGSSIILKTQSYLQEVEKNVRLASVEFRDIDGKFDFDSYYAAFLLESLKVNPQIALIYFGDTGGNFIQAGKSDSKIFLKRILHHGNDALPADYLYFDNNLQQIGSERKDNRNYDPRLRPWYKGALKNPETLFWTEPYIFFESGMPGITVASAVTDSQGNVKGVVAADILLNDLSSFLNELNLTPNETALITDEQGKILAASDEKIFTSDIRSYDDIPSLKESGNSILTALSDAYNETSSAECFPFTVDRVHYLGASIPFNSNFNKKWHFIISAPEDDFFGEFKNILNNILLLSMFGLFIGIVITWFLAKKISNPIEQLCRDVEQIKNFNFDFNSNIKSAITEIITMDNAIKAMKHSLKAFSLYVPKELVKKLIAEGEENISVGGHLEDLTIFFSDIAGFTSITEKTKPQILMHQLSEYFEVVTEVIEKYDGTVDKFIGDAVMAFWGAPVRLENHHELACRAALDVAHAIKKLNEKWEKEGKNRFITRIGLHSDSAVVGNIGSSSRMNYSIIGDGVNLASRLEGVNKIYGTGIIISESTYKKVAKLFVCRKLDKIAVKGKNESVTIYELLENADNADDKLLRFTEEWNSFFDLYLKSDWETALKKLDGFSKQFPEDKAASVFRERIEQLINGNTPSLNNGVFRMISK
jgi:adenylate cyclase